MSSTSTKTGADHLRSIDDGRTIFLDGEIIADPIHHPAFRNATQTVARLYDLQAAEPELMTFASPTTERRVGRHWHIPQSVEDLVARREAMLHWARASYGFFGRSPDHIPSALGGMIAGIEHLRRFDSARAGALVDYFQFARDHDLFVTYTIVNPQANQSKSASQQGAGDPPACRVIDEDADGITVEGAKMLGTSAVMANEVFVASIQPLATGEEAFALSFAVPLATPGVRIMSRKSYELHAQSMFDQPLSSRFDENDALIYFKQVKVPWERVFVHRNVAMAGAQFRDTWAAAMQNHHSQIRLMVKLRFLLGLARRITEINGTTDFPQVRDTLGRMAAQVSMVDAFVYGMEAAGEQVGVYYMPNRAIMHAATCLTQQLYPDFVNTIRELSGGGLIMLPSSAKDFDNAELRDYIGKTQRSPATDAYGRVKTMKLAWDALGSEFASRHVQYEMFYAGAQVFQRAAMFRNFDWSAATGLVDALLSDYDLPEDKRPG